MKKFLILLSLFCSPITHAADLVLFAALSGGGDTLAETTDGQKLSAGGFAQLSGGLESDLSENLILQGMLGWKFDTITADDGKASFDRFPIDINLISRTEKLELSFGISYHMNPKYKIQVDGFGTTEVSFDNAIGPSFGIGLLVNETTSLGLRFTSMEYEANAGTVDGNSAAIYASTSFGI